MNNMLELGKFTISPFDLERILELKIVKKMNDHATLCFCGIVNDKSKNSAVKMVSQSTKVKFSIDDKVIFSGILKNLNITSEGSVYYLEASVISNTALLDIYPIQRSFQQHGLTFKDITNQIIKESSGVMHFFAPEKHVRSIILQYKETNWEFIKRLASHSNSVLTPVVSSDLPEFFFGVDDLGYKEKLETFDYSVGIDMDMYWKLSQSPELGFTMEDAMTYTIKSDKFVLEVGDMVSVNDKALHVLSEELVLKDSVFSCTYTLVSKKAISSPMLFNEKITGLSIAGKVIDVISDTVKVHLHIDGTQNVATAYSFSYATSYSDENHTGWYVMPEIGDTVLVYFPTEDERNAFANASSRQVSDSSLQISQPFQINETSDTGNTPSFNKIDEPQVKYLRTPFGKEIRLEEKEIVITGKDGVTFIRINEDSGIEIVADEGRDIILNSGRHIIMKAVGSISMNSDVEEFSPGTSVEADTTGISMVAEKGDINTTADKGDISTIATEGDIGTTAKGTISATAETEDINIIAKKNINMIAETEEIEIDAETGDINITAKKNVTVIAETENINVEAENNINMIAEAEDIGILAKEGDIKMIAEAQSIEMDAKNSFDVKAGINVGMAATLATSISAGAGVSVLAGIGVSVSAGLDISMNALHNIGMNSLNKIDMGTKMGPVKIETGGEFNVCSQKRIATRAPIQELYANKSSVWLTSGDILIATGDNKGKTFTPDARIHLNEKNLRLDVEKSIGLYSKDKFIIDNEGKVSSIKSEGKLSMSAKTGISAENNNKSSINIEDSKIKIKSKDIELN